MRAVIRLAALMAGALACVACDPPVRRSEAESIAEDFADAETGPVSARVDDLQQKIEELNQEIEELKQKDRGFSRMDAAIIEDLGQQGRNQDAAVKWTQKHLGRLYRHESLPLSEMEPVK